MNKLIFIIVCLALSGNGFAEVYKWVDAAGRVYYPKISSWITKVYASF
jgi:hypothetical protein